jgi:plastocyanin
VHEPGRGSGGRVTTAGAVRVGVGEPERLAAAQPLGQRVRTAEAISLTAKNIAFDPTTLSAPAGKAFTIEFDNQDAGVQHDVAIFKGSDATAPVAFRGDLVTGSATISYDVPR